MASAGAWIVAAQATAKSESPAAGPWQPERWEVAVWIALVAVATALAVLLVMQRRGRRVAEAERETTEQHLRLAASVGAIGLWMRDLASHRSWSNGEHRAILGIGRDEPPDLGSHLDRVHPDDRERVTAAIGAALRSGGEYGVRHRVVATDGEERWVASHGNVRLDVRGGACIWGATSDVTARVRADLDAEVHRNELAHLSRVAMLGQLSGSIAHELNQPLTAILSNAQAALRFANAPHVNLEMVKEILRDIVADDKRAGEVIWRLRALFERGEAKSESVDPVRLIRDVVKMLRSDFISRNVTLTLDLAPGLPTVHTDAVQLQQVLLNLIVNACEAMANSEPGARSLMIRAVPGVQGDVAISVVDGGPGVAPERLEKIFEPFETSKPLGIGLGLVISRSIVAAHGGRLWCTNNALRGATFTFTIPCEPRPFADSAHGALATATAANKGVPA